MDIEKMSNIDISQDNVKSISEKCNQLKDLQKQIEDQEDKLKTLKNQSRDLEERVIPEMMQEAGVSLLKLADGSTVEVKPFYAAKIPESRVDEAFGYLRSNGFEDLIKNTVTASFGRNEDNKAKDLLADLQGQGMAVTNKVWVEPQTLKSFVKEQTGKGENIPHDLFGVFLGLQAKVRRK